MPSTQVNRVELLARMALFSQIDEDDLAEITSRFLDYHLDAGELLYSSGDRADNFYILQSGELQGRQIDTDQGDSIFSIEKGDSFGEGAMLSGGERHFSVSAVQDASLLYMPRQDFEWMLSSFPSVAEKLELQAAGDTMKGGVDFEWLGEDEVVHLVARKHSAYLWMRLSRALITAILAILTFYSAINTSDSVNQFRWVAAGGSLLFVAFAWGLWEFLDWRNDYYILTNLRVVWLEQVLLRSSSRKEAPLASIQSVNIHTNQLGRIMDFGDVIVRTFTGTVLMPAVDEPQHIKHMIEEYVARLRQKSREEKHDSIRQAVRQSLGRARTESSAPSRQTQSSFEMVDNSQRFQLFKTRKVEGETIIYHKHWFVLFSNLILPVFFLVAIAYILRTLYGGLPTTSTDWAIATVFIALPLVVVFYRFLDWRNDIYRLTADTLMDSEKKPLGSEVTKSAPLANVLSLENHRVGILGLLLNFGVVRINVGDSSLEFMDVHDPAQIQQDIFVRMEALKLSLDENEAEEERRRMAEWLKVYEEERDLDEAS